MILQLWARLFSCLARHLVEECIEFGLTPKSDERRLSQTRLFFADACVG